MYFDPKNINSFVIIMVILVLLNSSNGQCPPPTALGKCHCNQGSIGPGDITTELNCVGSGFPTLLDVEHGDSNQTFNWHFVAIEFNGGFINGKNDLHITTDFIKLLYLYHQNIDLDTLLTFNFTAIMIYSFDQVVIDSILFKSDLNNLKNIRLQGYDSDRQIDFGKFKYLESFEIIKYHDLTVSTYKSLNENAFTKNKFINYVTIEKSSLQYLGKDSLKFSSMYDVEIHLEGNKINTENLINSYPGNMNLKLDIYLQDNLIGNLPDYFAKYCDYSAKVKFHLENNPIECLPGEIDWFFEKPHCNYTILDVTCINLNKTKLASLTFEEFKNLTRTNSPRQNLEAWSIILICVSISILIVLLILILRYRVFLQKKILFKLIKSQKSLRPKANVPLPPIPISSLNDTHSDSYENFYECIFYEEVYNASYLSFKVERRFSL